MGSLIVFGALYVGITMLCAYVGSAMQVSSNSGPESSVTPNLVVNNWLTGHRVLVGKIKDRFFS